MTPEQQKAYDAYLELFMSTGWKQLMDSMSMQRDAVVQSAISCEDERTLYFKKGQLIILDNILGFEAALKAEIDEQMYQESHEGEFDDVV